MKTLTSYDFAGNEKYRFGLDRTRTAQVLRELADEIAKDKDSEILLQEVITYTEAQQDDYTMTTLVVRYHQKTLPMEPTLVGKATRQDTSNDETTTHL